MIVPIWQDGSLAGFDKPCGMHSVGETPNTLESGVREFWVSRGILADQLPAEAGLISRLDYHTSGLIFSAADKTLREAFMKGSVEPAMEKYYLSVCTRQEEPTDPSLCVRKEGDWTILESGFRAFGPGRTKVKSCSLSGKGSKNNSGQIYRTDFFPLIRFENSTLFLCRITNGFRHQIRVHLSSYGFPIDGDPLYGSSVANRLRLHSFAARFLHPLTGKTEHIDCPPQSDFFSLCDEGTFFLTLEKSRSLMSEWSSTKRTSVR